MNIIKYSKKKKKKNFKIIKNNVYIVYIDNMLIYLITFIIHIY